MMTNLNLILVFIFLTLLGIFLTLWGIVITTHDRRPGRTSNYLILTFVSILFYLILNYVNTTANDRQIIINTYKLVSAALTYIIYSWFFYALSLFAPKIDKRYPYIHIIWLFPLFIAMIQFWYPDNMDAFWGVVQVDEQPYLNIITIANRSNLFWVNWVQSYIFLAASLTMLILANLRKNRTKGVASWWAVAAVSIPILSNILYTLRLVSFVSPALMGIALTTSAAFVIIHIYQTRLEDLIPIARDMVIDSMQVGLITINQRGQIADINPFARSLATDKHIDPIGKYISDAFNNWSGLLAAILRHDQQQLEEELTHPTKRQFKVQIERLSGVSWQPGAKLITIIEITELNESRHAIMESEKKYRFLADNLADVLWKIKEGENKFSFVSPSASNMLGYSPEELIDLPLDKILTSDSLNLAIQNLQQLSVMREQIMNGDHLIMNDEYDIIAKNGKIIPTDVVSHAVINDAGEIEILGLARDISERKQNESKILSQQKLIAVNNERAQIGNELHDGIGQTLAYIHTHSQTIHYNLDKVPETKTRVDLEKITNASNQAIEQLREAIRAMMPVNESDAVSEEAPFADQLLALINEIKFRYKIGIHHNIAQNVPAAPFNVKETRELLQVIREALTNVAKHAKANEVNLFVQKIEKKINISIFDDGVGFDMINITNTDRSEGHFGLRIMRQRMEGMQGAFEISSAAGKGTQIILTVPIADKTPEFDRAALREFTYMIVDDHPIFIDGLYNLLSSFELRVIGTANGGEEAIKNFKALDPDIIFLDLNMKPMNGIDVLRVIKEIDPKTIVIILTVSEDDQTMFNAIRAGADGYLLKNMNVDNLLETLLKAVNGNTQLAPEFTTRLINRVSEKNKTMDDLRREFGLSEQQINILKLIHAGKTYDKIGIEMHLSVPTIKYHIKQITNRIGVSNKAGIIDFVTKYLGKFDA